MVIKRLLCPKAQTRILRRYKVKIISTSKKLSGFPAGSDRKESACNAGDMGSILWLGRSPGGGHGNPLQYSCLENPMDRGAWWATVHGVTRRWTWINQLGKANSFQPGEGDKLVNSISAKEEALRIKRIRERLVVFCCLVAQSCLTLRDPIDCSPPGSSVHGILWARILEWVAISFSGGSSQPRDQTQASYTGRQILYHWATRKPRRKGCMG